MKSSNMDSAWPDFIKSIGGKNVGDFQSEIKAIDFLCNSENWNVGQIQTFVKNSSIFDIFKLIERLVEHPEISNATKKECIQSIIMAAPIIEREIKKDRLRKFGPAILFFRFILNCNI